LLVHNPLNVTHYKESGMDLSLLSISELKGLLESIPKEIKKREKDEKAKALKELAAFAAERGFTLDELVAGGLDVKKIRAPVAVKYRHPQNPDLTWTGRGRKPKWVADFLESGKPLEALAA